MRTIWTTAVIGLALAATACDSGGGEADKPAAAPVQTAADRRAAEEKAEADAREAARLAEIAALTQSFADSEAFVAACSARDLDAKICECAAKATVDTVGAAGLNAWVYDAYILGDRMAYNRSNKFFADNAVAEDVVQKFKDDVGKCYVR